MTIPKHVLDQIGEYTPSGFILFSSDTEGSPEVTYCFESNMVQIGLQTFVALWSQAIQENQHEQMINSLNHNCDEDEE